MTSPDRAWRPSGLVSLLTDFGMLDPYVGIMKGVLYGRSRDLRAAIDLGHDVPPQDVRAAAFHLAHSRRWFPNGTVHVCVVDPGVGSGRRILAALDGGHAFLAPDNGVLGPALGPQAEVFELDAARHGLPRPSRTFHGRDVFMPAAALLVDGAAPAELGAPAGGWERLRFPAHRPREGAEAGAFDGEVLLADRFGNLITNLPASLLGERAGDGAGLATLEVAGRRIAVRGTYAEVARGELLALVDSYGLLEVAVRDGDAARLLGVGAGAAVALLPGA